MLYHLRVKNLALIDSAEVEFGDGLNILTGETGAGKSIIIGSVQIALGGKAPKEMIRRGCDSAYIELVFSIDDERKREQLKEHDVYPDEEGILIISKKITPTRSISRINDETVTAARLREITGLLIDLHGQHEHQSLVNASKHLEILDAYGGEKLLPFKQNTEAAYRLYMQLKQKCAAFASDQETRLREMDFCRFEIEEIENAALKDGEEEKVAADFKRFSNARRIAESLSQAYDAVSGDAVSRAFREIDGAMAFDEGLKGIRDELCDVDSLLSDLSREIAGYMDDMTFDEAAFRETQERLDLIRSLETKYGKTIPEVLQALEEKKARLQELENYDELREQAEKELEQAVLASIRTMAQLVRGAVQTKQRQFAKDTRYNHRIDRQIKAHQNSIQMRQQEKMAAFEDMVSGKVSSEDYQHKRGQCEKHIQRLEIKIKELEATKRQTKEEELSADSILPYTNVRTLTRELVDLLIQNIYIFSSTSIEIVWKCGDEYQRLLADTAKKEAVEHEQG